MLRPSTLIRLLIATAVVAAATGVIGRAAGLTTSGGSLGAAQVAVSRCTTSGVTVNETLSGSNVTALTLGNIPSACVGTALSVTLDDNVTPTPETGSASCTLGTSPCAVSGPAGGPYAVGPLGLSLSGPLIYLPLTSSAEVDIAVSGP